jgi:hypothetical protein
MEHEAIYELYPNVKSIEVDNDNNFIFYDNNSNVIEVDINWDTVNTKASELQTAFENTIKTNKENKLSAYRKMSMTDDEIRAIDPSLLD